MLYAGLAGSESLFKEILSGVQANQLCPCQFFLKVIVGQADKVSSSSYIDTSPDLVVGDGVGSLLSMTISEAFIEVS